MKRLAPVLALLGLAACAGGTRDARYPARERGCPVRVFPGAPSMPVDQLGEVTVPCMSNGGGSCERQLLDAVCAEGGDVVWGVGDNALTSSTLTGHAAHSRRAAQGPRERGCDVKVLADSTHTENIGPVAALCAPDDAPEACTRELLDQVCLLGGDAVWQVEGPTPIDTQNGPRQQLRGRAVHTK